MRQNKPKKLKCKLNTMALILSPKPFRQKVYIIRINDQKCIMTWKQFLVHHPISPSFAVNICEPVLPSQILYRFSLSNPVTASTTLRCCLMTIWSTFSRICAWIGVKIEPWQMKDIGPSWSQSDPEPDGLVGRMKSSRFGWAVITFL